MISKQLPPMMATPTARSTSAAGSHGFEGQEITPDLISMGSELGCPFLASLKKPEFANLEGESTGDKPDLSRMSKSTAALAAAAGGLGMGAASACCPHTSGKSDAGDQQQQPKPPQHPQ